LNYEFGFAIAKVLNKLIYTNYYIIHHLKFVIEPPNSLKVYLPKNRLYINSVFLFQSEVKFMILKYRFYYIKPDKFSQQMFGSTARDVCQAAVSI